MGGMGSCSCDKEVRTAVLREGFSQSVHTNVIVALRC